MILPPAQDRPACSQLTVGKWLSFLLILALSACSDSATDSPTKEGAAPSQAPVREMVQARVTREFRSARQLMPKGVDADNLYSILAPLFFVEGEVFPRFGVLAGSEGDGIRSGPMRLYFRENKGFIAGAERRIISYVWWEQLPSGFRPQGVRMVLDEWSMPRLFEVLSDSSGSRVFYVSARVEALAKKQFQSLATDRRFHVENPAVADDQAIVARVLADGPIPLGPWAYVESLGGDVMSLICRCMPSQLKGPAQREDYELKEWPRETAQLFPFDALPVNGDGSIDSLVRLPGF